MIAHAIAVRCSTRNGRSQQRPTVHHIGALQIEAKWWFGRFRHRFKLFDSPLAKEDGFGCRLAPLIHLYDIFEYRRVLDITAISLVKL